MITHHIGLLEVKGSSRKGLPMNFGRGKMVSPINASNNGNTSEEDEPSYTDEGNGENSNGGRDKKGSMWHRMKWTDNVVRLLIAAVACVGDDGTIDGVEGLKRKSGILQKKGKWKTVSKIMISRGCQVSPQQYKKLNDILGKGLTCQVVENPALIDTMSCSHLSAKAKDDVRKILGSKHLFYKEMFAYHNGKKIPNCHDIDLQGCSVPSDRSPKGNDESEEEEADRNNDTDDDESDNEDDRNDDEDEGRMMAIHGRNLLAGSVFEMKWLGFFQDPSKSMWERREWIKKQKLALQNQRVSIQAQAFELEKQHLKWLRYCSKKDRELERSRLENERIRLDNEQMILHLKQKQFELDLRKTEVSLEPTSLGNRDRDRDQIDDLGRHQ
ncbi:F16F4.11 protein [Citrus sinensis]|uniref:F16F4.11 protein n=1 Tax=Citrus sinensis TaxID=2711 RepID=A0ACB8MWA4_CITSI|nr:F16F4.11 protein [Citrus sinensis]